MPLVKHSSYKPPSILFNAHLQTVFPSVFRKINAIKIAERERIHTADDDFLDLDWYRKDGKKLVILSHGLEGDSRRPYIQGMVKAFVDQGWDAMAWNFRGCSGEINKQLRFYHSGATDDLHWVIQHAMNNKAYDEIILIGFSLGGNMTLKYLGEQGKALNSKIKKVITFSVPLNLHSSCLKISQPSNYIYSQRFLKNLKQKVKDKSVLMPDKLNLEGYYSVKKLMEFDDYYTAPIHGFRDAKEYYDTCSSIHFLKGINIPTLIVNAQNDPFLSSDCYPYEKLENHKLVYFEAPPQGGHCGFPLFNKENLYWSEKRALEFAMI